MRSGTIAFLFGILLFQYLPGLPDPYLIQFLPVLLVLAVRPGLRLPALLGCGFLWALFRAALILAHPLPIDLEGKNLRIDGVITSVPVRDGIKTQFLFETNDILGYGRTWHSPGLIRLNWYGNVPRLRPGERWLLTVRLKRPHGFMNPGSFDYERWLFQQGIVATGYVRDAHANQMIDRSERHLIATARQHAQDRIDEALDGTPFVGIVKALAIGMRADIPDEQWRVLRTTGTAHLMAISGLHIGLIAGIAFLLMRILWPLSGTPALFIAAPTCAAIGAILAALGYAALAGFSIPTQRALVMVVVTMLGILSRRNIPISVSLAWALMLVLLLDPFAVLSPGFWLSFGAVAAILWGMSARLGMRNAWWKWGRVHWVVTLGIVPLTMVFFQQHPLLSPFANFFAVPWTGLVVVPLTLVGTGLAFVSPQIGAMVLGCAESAVSLVWPLLSGIADLDLVYTGLATPPLWTIGASAVGVALMLLPKGMPVRWLGAIWLLPLFLVSPARPSEGEVWFTLLDVGQGLAAVVRTRQHTLLYDSGPRYSTTFDAGRAVVAPYLHRQGLHAVNVLVVSHGDNDHVGGINGLLESVKVERIVGNGVDTALSMTPCQAGMRWHWDGIDFEILHPGTQLYYRRNDGSCVLRVSGPGGTVLLPGDIEQEAETQLIDRYAGELAVDVLVAPHHGSKTSSTGEFLEATRPRYALFPVGYRNRFRFPHAEVVQRYIDRGTVVLSSACHGAISFKIAPGHPLSPELHRDLGRRFWHQPSERL